MAHRRGHRWSGAIARAARVIRQQADLHAFQRGEPGGAKHVDTGLHRRVDRRRHSWCLRIKHAARAGRPDDGTAVKADAAIVATRA